MRFPKCSIHYYSVNSPHSTPSPRFQMAGAKPSWHIVHKSLFNHMADMYRVEIIQTHSHMCGHLDLLSPFFLIWGRNWSTIRKPTQWEHETSTQKSTRSAGSKPELTSVKPGSVSTATFWLKCVKDLRKQLTGNAQHTNKNAHSPLSWGSYT